MDQLAKWIKEANHTVVFTGAGMSTESGLPDFRSKESGLWQRFNPQELATIEALYERTDDFLAFYHYRLQAIDEVKPHHGHDLLAKWEDANLIKSIITQNVDGFHHEAGNEQVMELHGSFRSFYCHECGETYQPSQFLQGISSCSCGGTIRPNIVLFGESLPMEAFQLAEKTSKPADLFIVLGSSLTVSPANMFPLLAKENGAKLVIINHDPTPYDSYADRVIQNISIKEALQQIDRHL